jgi:hypothetical protein
MEPDTVHALISQVRRDREDMVRRIAKFDAVLTDLAALYPDAFVDSDPVTDQTNHIDVPETQPARVKTDVAPRTFGRGVTSAVITDVLRDAAGSWLTVEQVTEQALSRGWGVGLDDPASVLRTALRRAVQSGSAARRDSQGRGYEYATPTNAESPAATGLSVVPDHDSPEGGEADGTGDHRDHDPHQGHRDHAGGAPSVVEG